jgi:hypothetical protein
VGVFGPARINTTKCPVLDAVRLPATVTREHSGQQAMRLLLFSFPVLLLCVHAFEIPGGKSKVFVLNLFPIKFIFLQWLHSFTSLLKPANHHMVIDFACGKGGLGMQKKARWKRAL